MLSRSPGLYFSPTPMKTAFIYTAAVVAIAAACSQTPPAAAQTPVHWTVAPVHGAISNGTVAHIKIDATIQTGWHIYSITQPPGGPYATRISVPDGQSFAAAGDPRAVLPPHVAFDSAFKMNVQLHEKTASFDVPVRFTGKTAAGDSVHVNVRYQVCNASLCLPPQTAKLVAPVATEAR
jgi:cytochrome c biogenesis DsbD-like protein